MSLQKRKPRQAIKLTKARVDREGAPHKSGKQFIVWDSEIRGFGLLISGTTNAKSYIVQRDVNGKTRRLTVGRINILELNDARKRAAKLILQLTDGHDPKSKSKADTFTLREALETYLTNQKGLREKTVNGYRTTLQNRLTGWLDKPLKNITSEMVRNRHRKIQEEVEKRKRTKIAKGHSAANGTIRALRAIWNHAKVLFPDLPDNPVKLTKREWYPEPRREGVVKVSDLSDFYDATLKLENPIQRDCIQLILFTGLRSSEARALSWEEVDFEGKIIRLPSMRLKSGRKLDLPMSDFVCELLKTRQKEGRDKWVFPAISRSGHIEELKYPLSRIKKQTGFHFTPHDLRRTFITVAESCNIPVFALKGLVNHTMGTDVTAGYVVADAERLREPMQKVTDRLKKQVGITRRGKVVHFPKAKAD
jgi:integrase